MNDDEYWMSICLALAEKAAQCGEVPVGAIVVLDGEVIGEGYNTREESGDPTAHAEVNALRKASETLGHWRILDATLYVTLEPCSMCAGALVNARIKRVVYGCDDPKAGAVSSLYQLVSDIRLNHRVEVTKGVRADECAGVLRRFFEARRKAKSKGKTQRK